MNKIPGNETNPMPEQASWAAEHSLIQVTLSEINNINNPALRLAVAEYLVNELQEVAKTATNEIVTSLNNQPK